MIDQLSALVLSNATVSALSYFAGRTFLGACHICSRFLTTSVELMVSDEDDTVWIKKFILMQCRGKLAHVRIRNREIRRRYYEDSDDEESDHMVDDSSDSGFNDSDSKKSQKNEFNINDLIDPLTSNRSVFFWYKRTLIRVNRVASGGGIFSSDIFQFTAYATRNKQILLNMIEEARQLAEEKPEKFISYYKAAIDSECWRLVRQNKPRAISSVVLKEGITKVIQDDVDDFIKSRKWYTDRGIPYRRGYLLYGPAGCGKTSFVKAISGSIGYDIYEIPLSDRGLDDQILSSLMQDIGSKGILLLEDVDSVFGARMQDEERAQENDVVTGKLSVREMKSSVTFSGLLNAIDGVTSKENYIIFMTTNHRDRLDSALIRPGRIDIKQLIDYPDEDQIVALFSQFYPECDREIGVKFASTVKNLKCQPSVAQIQGIFLQHKHKPEENVTDVESLNEMCKETTESNLYI